MRANILLFFSACGFLQAGLPLHERMDNLIREKAMGQPFSGICDDATFLRRVTLDLTGNIPTSGEVSAFLKDQSQEKRKKLIDRLIANDLFADHWMERLTVMLLERLDQGKVTKREWGDFLKQTLREKPLWDVMVREMIEAKGQGPARPAMKFLGTADHHAMTENVARLLLGMDLTCARPTWHTRSTAHTRPRTVVTPTPVSKFKDPKLVCALHEAVQDEHRRGWTEGPYIVPRKRWRLFRVRVNRQYSIIIPLATDLRHTLVFHRIV